MYRENANTPFSAASLRELSKAAVDRLTAEALEFFIRKSEEAANRGDWQFDISIYNEQIRHLDMTWVKLLGIAISREEGRYVFSWGP